MHIPPPLGHSIWQDAALRVYSFCKRSVGNLNRGDDRKQLMGNSGARLWLPNIDARQEDLGSTASPSPLDGHQES